MRIFHLTMFGLGALGAASAAQAQSDTNELAKQLANPISSLISVPFQFNVDYGGGPDGDGANYYLHFQPVIPFELNADWNVISRTIVPLSYVQGIFPDNVGGFGDTEQSFFFSPKDAGIPGLTWGVGPIFLIPTATDSELGTGKWGAGPTAVALMQQDKWTVGVLANQVWSVAGDPDRADVSLLFLQPFVSYALGEGQTVNLDLEASYNWESEDWSVPMNLSYTKVFHAGDQPMSIQIGARKYLDNTPGGPDWGLRANLSWLFPSAGKKKN